jgi:putative intracellular protease/amidase
MAKPIFVITADNNNRSPQRLHQISVDIAAQLKDYHVLIVPGSSSAESFHFECFNAPHTKIQFEELKERVLEAFKQSIAE